MEAIERVDKQPNSFEDIDRILTIVEESKREFDQAKKKEIGFMSILALSVLLTSLFLLYIFVYLHIEIDKLIAVIAVLNGVSNIILFMHNFGLLRRKQKHYNQSIVGAIEAIRELIPVMSHLEKWSALQKFELRLRMSKLDISLEGILDDSRL